jgi:hypothetical protein
LSSRPRIVERREIDKTVEILEVMTRSKEKGMMMVGGIYRTRAATAFICDLKMISNRRRVEGKPG